MATGKVFLVGAGPGDPGLLTLRGLECLKQADLVLYDGLVNPLLLRHTNGQVERTARTRIGNGPHVPQADVNARLIEAAQSGLTVVRLKGGDPFIFGRGAEETAALEAHGIPYEVIPGVTAATAAAVYTGLSLTHRDYASSVTLVTGHEEHSRVESRIDYHALANLSGTLVFYMGLDRLEQITTRLREGGKPDDTAVAVVCQATWPTQRIATGTLADIGPKVQQARLHAPSLIIVGEAVAHRQPADWFDQRPLKGLSIGLARAEEQLDPVLSQVQALGGEAVPMPLISIAPPDDWSRVDQALDRLGDYRWLVLTSVNGVKGFFGRLWEKGKDARSLAGIRIAVIGPATRDSLQAYGVRADLMPDVYRAEALAEALIPDASNGPMLWARANRGRDVMPEAIRAAGGQMDEVVVYHNQDVTTPTSDLEQRLRSGRLNWVALSSPSIARGMARVLQSDSLKDLPSEHWPRMAAISPVTAEAAVEAGLTVEVTAGEYTWPGLLQAIASASRRTS